MIKILRTPLLGLLVLPLAAQSTDISVNGGLIRGLDSLKKATNNRLAYTVGGDYHTHIWGTEVPARIGLSLASMPGKEKFGLKTSLTLIQAHGDVFVETPSPALRGFAGLSINKYSMSTAGTESSTPEDIDHHFPVRDVKGLKLGLRVGLAYAFTKNVSGDVMLQQTELAGKDLQDPLIRQGGINPAWLQLGVNYRF